MSDRICFHIQKIIEELGEDSQREGLIETPARVAKAFREYFSGYQEDPAKILAKDFWAGGQTNPVILSNIEFSSHCEHHLAPIIGKASIAYLPKGRVVGISKLARLVDCYAKRMQIQERMTKEIADALEIYLEPEGVIVIIEAEHHCMKTRGVKKISPIMKTMATKGLYLDPEFQHLTSEVIRQMKD